MTALVTKHLPLLSDAPDGIRRIRQLIVDLAVSGKLIPQGSTDDWPQVQLSDIVTSFQNGVSSRGAANGQAVAVLRLADIKSGEISLDDLRTLMLDAETIEKYLLVDGDMLVIRVNGSADLVGRFIVHRESGGALHCDHFIRLRLDRERVEPRFLKLIGDCSSTRASIQGLFVSTAGQKTVNQGHIGSLAVPLPPLAKQHRIVAKVNELMALCDRLEADQTDAEAAHAQLVQALLDSLTQATDAADFRASRQRLSEHFHTLFTTEASIDALKQTVLQLAVMGKLVPQIKRDGSAMDLLASIATIGKSKATVTPAVDENLPAVPPSWCWIRIADLAHVGTGATPSRTNPAYFDPPEISWVTSGETSQAFVLSTEQKVSPLALNETNLTVYPVGTLVVAMYGQGKTRGQVTELLIEACTNQACAAIQLICDDSAHRKFVKYFFEKSYDELRSIAAGGAQPNLNLGKIKETLMPLPPLAEQHRIVAKVDELMALCDQLKAQLAEARQQHAQLATVLVEQAVA